MLLVLCRLTTSVHLLLLLVGMLLWGRLKLLLVVGTSIQYVLLAVLMLLVEVHLGILLVLLLNSAIGRGWEHAPKGGVVAVPHGLLLLVMGLTLVLVPTAASLGMRRRRWWELGVRVVVVVGALGGAHVLEARHGG